MGDISSRNTDISASFKDENSILSVQQVRLYAIDQQNISTENRWELRDQVYYREMPDIQVCFQKRDLSILSAVKDISIRGIGLCNEKFSLDMVGEKVLITLGDKKKYSVSGIIQTFSCVKFAGKMQNRIGVVFISSKNGNIKRPKRFSCPSNFPAAAYGEHPFRYNHNMLFSIIDFSSSGMTIKGIFKENILFPGTVIFLNILLPSLGEFQVKLEVTNIRSGFLNKNQSLEKEKYFLIGGVFVEPTYELLTAISSYILLDGNSSTTIEDLQANGFIVPKMDPVISFSYVSCEKEWDEVLKLRLRAAQHAGRWIGEIDHYKLVDANDKHARQLVCKIQNKIVACARIVFNDGDVSKTEHGKLVSIPNFLFQSGFVEASRLCTDPSYRGSSIFLCFLQHVGKMLGQLNIRYVLMNCEDSLVPIYKRYGAELVGEKFYTQFMQGKALNLIVCDMRSYYFGKKVGPLYWYIMWKDVGEFLLKNKFITTKISDYFRMKIYSLIGSMFFKFISKKQYKRNIEKRSSVLLSFKTTIEDVPSNVNGETRAT